jgi:serine/threonine-protein kinase HipA
VNYSPVVEIKVGLSMPEGIASVGRLALRERQIYFEYSKSFLECGIELSPLHLPLQPGVTTFDRLLFEGLPGLFNDSLPDGWGRLLLDRSMRSLGVLPEELSPLDRLAHVGQAGMGALIYEPDHALTSSQSRLDLDVLAEQTQEVLDGQAQDVLQELLALNGSSAGARPKAVIGVDGTRQHIVHGAHELQPSYEPWLVKFANSTDGVDAGAIEYVYALMAKAAGLDVPEVHLFSARNGSGYFATKRFDRHGHKRVHIHSACGLLHSDFRTPSLDYQDLIALTSTLTRDIGEVEKLFQLSVFNVLAHNRDDHAKNFSFLINTAGEWKLSPAYDLTFSSGPGGEQSTMVMGEGRAPGIEHLIKLGQEAKLNQKYIDNTISHTQRALSKWKALAKEYGVSRENITLIDKKIMSIA